MHGMCYTMRFHHNIHCFVDSLRSIFLSFSHPERKLQGFKISSVIFLGKYCLFYNSDDLFFTLTLSVLLRTFKVWSTLNLFFIVRLFTKTSLRISIQTPQTNWITEFNVWNVFILFFLCFGNQYYLVHLMRTDFSLFAF